jgi:hypothetical protein
LVVAWMMCSYFKDKKVFQFFIHLLAEGTGVAKGGTKHIIIYISTQL